MKRILFLIALILTGIGVSWGQVAGGTATAYTESSGYSDFSYSTIVNWRQAVQSSAKCISTSTMSEIAADGTEGSTYTHAWGTNGNGTSGRFCNSSKYTTSYAAPGMVLRYSGTAGTDYCAVTDATFTPLSLGGLIVDGTGYSISSNTTSERDIELGSAGYSTYFKINQNFSITRKTAADGRFFGTVNLAIASGKTLTMTVTNSSTTGMEVVDGATLKMSGEGTLASNIISNGTLDFSALGTTRTTPYISGNLTLNKIDLKFAEGTDVTNYVLCSGTLSATTLTGKITIGETVYDNVRIVLDLTNKKIISYSTTNTYTISSGTEKLSDIDLTKYNKIIVSSGATLNVDKQLNVDVEGAGTVSFSSTYQIANAIISGVTLSSSSRISLIGNVTIDGLPKTTAGATSYIFLNSGSTILNVSGTSELTNNIGFGSGASMILAGNAKLTLNRFFNTDSGYSSNGNLTIGSGAELVVSAKFNVANTCTVNGTFNYAGTSVAKATSPKTGENSLLYVGTLSGTAFNLKITDAALADLYSNYSTDGTYTAIQVASTNNIDTYWCPVN